jgi:hypothetical protein
VLYPLSYEAVTRTLEESRLRGPFAFALFRSDAGSKAPDLAPGGFDVPNYCRRGALISGAASNDP